MCDAVLCITCNLYANRAVEYRDGNVHPVWVSCVTNFTRYVTLTNNCMKVKLSCSVLMSPAWQRSYCRRLWMTWRQSFRTWWRRTQRPSLHRSFSGRRRRLLLQLQLWSVSRMDDSHTLTCNKCNMSLFLGKHFQCRFILLPKDDHSSLSWGNSILQRNLEYIYFVNTWIWKDEATSLLSQSVSPIPLVPVLLYLWLNSSG